MSINRYIPIYSKKIRSLDQKIRQAFVHCSVLQKILPAVGLQGSFIFNPTQAQISTLPKQASNPL